MVEIEKAAARLKQLREVIKALAEEEESLKRMIVAYMEEKGITALQVSGVTLTLTAVTTYQYSGVLKDLVEKRPDLAAMVEELKEKRKTTYKKLEIK